MLKLLLALSSRRTFPVSAMLNVVWAVARMKVLGLIDAKQTRREFLVLGTAWIRDSNSRV